MKQWSCIILVFSFVFLPAKSGKILSQYSYCPVPYESMPQEYKENVSLPLYSSFVHNIKTLDDIEFYDITYMSDGYPVHGFMVQPHLEPNKTYPVIIYNRGGLREWGMVDLIDVCTHFYTFAKAGYIVLASQYRGCNGASGKDEFGGAEIHDVLNLVSIAHDLPYTQNHNLFMVGFSRGGLMTYLALKHKAPVNAVAVLAGITDVFAFERIKPDWALLMTIFVGTLGIPKIQAYSARSVVRWVDEINTPILLMHNEQDPVVPLSQSLEFARLLDMLNKPYKLITYDDSTHQLSKYRDDAYKNILAWFDQHTV